MSVRIGGEKEKLSERYFLLFLKENGPLIYAGNESFPLPAYVRTLSFSHNELRDAIEIHNPSFFFFLLLPFLANLGTRRKERVPQLLPKKVILGVEAKNSQFVRPFIKFCAKK